MGRKEVRAQAVYEVALLLKVTKKAAAELLDSYGRNQGETGSEWADRVITAERRASCR